MKTFFFIVAIILISFPISKNVFSQKWTAVGDSIRISKAAGPDTYIAMYNNDTPYVAFRDAYYGGATVKKFDGNNWIDAGIPGFSDGDMHDPSMAFDNNNTLYVGYTDYLINPGGRATVMKFDGNNWVTVGVQRFTPGTATSVFLSLDGNGIPYVSFRDFAYGARASVMKFDGFNWVYVGIPGFSSGEVMYTSLSIDKNGIPYVGYWDIDNDYMAIMKFDGSNWVNVGQPGFGDWTANNNKAIIFDSSNTAYVVCAKYGKAAVMKFTGSNWIPVGSTGISQGSAGFTSIVMDAEDTPYIAYSDGAYGGKATVMKYDGINWVNVGNPGFTPADAWYHNLAIDKKKTLYLSFTNGPGMYAGVMKFENVTMLKSETKNYSSILVYPNPANNTFILTYQIPEPISNLEIEIKNTIGQTIFSSCYNTKRNGLSEEINLSGQPKGIYFVVVLAGEKIEVRKIVLQ